MIDFASVGIIKAATADAAEISGFGMDGREAGENVNGGDKLATLAARAMTAVLDGVPTNEREKMGWVVGTTLGCLETDREFDRSRREAEGRYASPAAFSRTLPSTIAAEMAIRFGLRGPSLVVSAGAVSTAMAIQRAMRWMEHFELEHCIVAGMDWRESEQNDERIYLAAIVLLGRKAKAWVSLDALPSIHKELLGTAVDASLLQLANWVREPRSMDLGAGVSVRL